MFESLKNTAFMNELKVQATPIILEDRKKYDKVYQIIEEYCEKNDNLIVSDIKKLTNQSDSIAFKVYEIYIENPYKHAISITNKIYQKIGKWTQMTTVILHQEFEIYFDGRNVAKIYNIVKGKDITLAHLINPIRIENIDYMSPEIELIDVYKRLYLPDKYSEWHDLLHDETALFDLVQTRNVEVGLKFGGTNFTPPNRRDPSDLEKIKTIVLEEYIYDRLNATENDTSNGIILLGHWALNIIDANLSNQAIIPHVEKMQIISPDYQRDIKNIQLILQKTTNFSIAHREHILHLPKDFRIKRHTLYLVGSEKQMPFMDIFNASEFELIPFNILKMSNKQVKIANMWVLLRFMMVDIWMLKVIFKIGKIYEKSFIEKMKALYDGFFRIKQSKSDDIKKVFGIHYIGTNIDYTSAKKLERLKYKVYPYIPAKSKKSIA